MNLNKHKKKYHKMHYDGRSIIKIGARELYPIVYKRIWDLTKYDANTLESYGLKKAIYIYVGSSEEFNLRRRCNSWIGDIRRSKVAKEIRVFIRDLERFLEHETNLAFEEKNELLYYNAKIIARCKNRKDAFLKEFEINKQYHHLDFLGEILEQHIILLSKADSNLIEVEQDGLSALKSRKKIA